jgi:hypothetical protein
MSTRAEPGDTRYRRPGDVRFAHIPVSASIPEPAGARSASYPSDIEAISDWPTHAESRRRSLRPGWVGADDPPAHPIKLRLHHREDAR